jgi:uncharacterized protein (DUF302 family)
MAYNIARKTGGDFDAVVGRVEETFKSEDFGVLTEIDVAGTLKAKIGGDFRSMLYMDSDLNNPVLERNAERPRG